MTAKYDSESPPPDAPKDVPAGLQVLILCSGKILGWDTVDGGIACQLRPWQNRNAESVLQRQIRQVQDRTSVDPIIVTHREDIKLHTPDLMHYQPEKRRTIARTWLSTVELWREQTLVLLGDCVFGSQTMEKMLNHRGPMWMTGNDAEIFAFTFCQDEHQRVIDMLYEVNAETQKGAPWAIYKCWVGYPKPYHQGQRHLETTRVGNSPRDESCVFQWVWDRCCDIDNNAEYASMLRVDWGKG